MISTIRKNSSSLKLSNGMVEAVFSIDKRFRLESFKDLKTKKNICSQKEYLIVFDRENEDLSIKGSAKFANFRIRKINDCFQNSGMEAIFIFKAVKSGLDIEKHIFIYDKAPAVRIFDVFRSGKDLAGLYNSDILNVKFEKPFTARCVEFFTCTDQSNYRLIEKKAEIKNKAGFFITDTGVFLYKEGPMPDSQPIKGEYDFMYDKNSRTVSAAGLGFDKIRKGEVRRANGIVIGLTEDGAFTGLKKYQQTRYRINYDNDIEYLANTWPAFHLEVTEEKILKEIENASKCGINTVFIDDGWFKTFMGDVDVVKFPSGLKAVSSIARKKGINLGLWMNPMGLDSKDPKAEEWDGAECHDSITEGNKWNWVARGNDFTPVETMPSEGVRVYYGMDLMNPEYYSHIKNKIVTLYEKYGIKRLKFDLYQLNRYDTLLGDQNQHYEKYRELLEELKRDLPDLVISMDITRKNRPCFDFGMDFGRLFMENRGRTLKDHRYYHPYISLRNLWYTSKYFPAQKMELEMMPQIDDYPIEYVLSTTIFTNPLYWGSLTELSAEKLKIFNQFIKKLEPHKNEIMKGLIFPIGEMPEKGNWSGFISIDGDSKGYLGIYRNGAETVKHRFKTNLLKPGKYVFNDVFSGEKTYMKRTLEFNIDEKFGFRLFKFERACEN
jgi:hypothetical protein